MLNRNKSGRILINEEMAALLSQAADEREQACINRDWNNSGVVEGKMKLSRLRYRWRLFYWRGCSYATKNGSELNVASVGNSCAAAGDGTNYAVSCANPEREKVLKSLLMMVERKHNEKN